MKKIITTIILAVGCSLGIAQNLVKNGDFSDTTVRTNGTFTGFANFPNGASNWYIPNSYNIGVSNGYLKMDDTYWLNSRFHPSVNVARQNLDVGTGDYIVKFDYQIVGNDPWYGGNGISVKFGDTNFTTPWVSGGWVSESFNTHLSGGNNMLELGTLKAPKGSYDSMAKSYVKFDNISVTPVPENLTLTMMLAGVGVLGFKINKRKKM